LLTLTTSQLERLRPLLEAQSDERHDVALSEQPGNVSIIGRAAPLQHEAQNRLKAEVRSLPFHRKSPFSIVLPLM
jgi:type VI secretion system protein VasG